MHKAISCLASLVFISGAFTAAAQEKRTVSFRALCYQHMGDVKYVSLPAPAAGAPVQVPLPTSGFGTETKGVFEDGMVRFFAENSNPPKVIAEGKLAKSERQVFLFLPSPDAKMVYRVHALNDDEASFAMGSTRVLNLGAVKIRLNFAGADLPPIEPGGMAIYPMVKTADEWGMFTARVDYDNGKGGWTPVSSQSWKSAEEKRDMVIATVDPKTKRPSIRQYQDIPPWRVAALPTGGPK
ncbi:hypothetical protein [Luteolibacter sp. Populi]|uniref:hypothetical protein n=1 Tax=Luteolibacter sp. Populi TaxID=3230487 RepID=UPI003465C2AB